MTPSDFQGLCLCGHTLVHACSCPAFPQPHRLPELVSQIRSTFSEMPTSEEEMWTVWKGGRAGRGDAEGSKN